MCIRDSYENIGEIPEDTIGTPDMHFFIYESYLIFDHKKEKVYVVEMCIRDRFWILHPWESKYYS